MNGQYVRSAQFDGRNWAQATDEEIFADQVVTWGGEDTEAFKKEKEKRLNKKRMEQERIERERAERVNAAKDAITYSDAIAQTICERISSGELLTIVCRDDDMPTMRRVQRWLKEYPEFQAVFNMSIQDRLFVFEEQVIEIADDMKNDFKTVIENGKEKRVADPDMVARAKLRIEVRFRHLKSGKPNKWGDVGTLNVRNDDKENLDNISTDELERRLADMEAKDRILKSVARGRGR
jgi:hypothetical protein